MRKQITLLLIMVLLFSLAPAVQAETIDVDAPASITIQCDTPNVDFRIYRVGSVAADGKLSLSGAFQDSNVLMDNQSTSDYKIMAGTLYAYASQKGIQPDATATTDRNGNCQFGDLSVGLYLVMGSAYQVGSTIYIPEPFLVTLPSYDGDGKLDYDVQTTPKNGNREENQTITIHVLKVWDDNANAQRPSSVRVQLLQDGRIYGEPITLSKQNNWRYSWTNMDPNHIWSVFETEIPSGYTAKVEQTGDSFVITNHMTGTTPVPDPGEPILPQTGKLQWPIPILAEAGMVLLLLGWILRRRGNTCED